VHSVSGAKYVMEDEMNQCIQTYELPIPCATLRLHHSQSATPPCATGKTQPLF
jgi:hypothetical protein